MDKRTVINLLKAKTPPEKRWKCTQCGNRFKTEDVYTSTGVFYHWSMRNYDCGPVVEENNG
jgi:transposase-like protein